MAPAPASPLKGPETPAGKSHRTGPAPPRTAHNNLNQLQPPPPLPPPSSLGLPGNPRPLVAPATIGHAPFESARACHPGNHPPPGHPIIHTDTTPPTTTTTPRTHTPYTYMPGLLTSHDIADLLQLTLYPHPPTSHNSYPLPTSSLLALTLTSHNNSSPLPSHGHPIISTRPSPSASHPIILIPIPHRHPIITTLHPPPV